MAGQCRSEETKEQKTFRHPHIFLAAVRGVEAYQERRKTQYSNNSKWGTTAVLNYHSQKPKLL